MRRVFVSSCDVDAPHPAALIALLGAESLLVSHSPVNPATGDDSRWRDWYSRGCRSELEHADIFVIVLSAAWDNSTWMGHECAQASSLLGAGKIKKMCYWNPEGVEVRAKGMLPYLRDRLPDEEGQLLAALKGFI